MDLSLFFVGFAFGGVILVVFNFYRAWREITSQQEDDFRKLEELVDRLENQKLIILEVEAVDDQFLCYNLLTKEFVCMGRNMTEVQERFQQRYPNREAAIIKEDLAAQQLKAT